jgi:hypothetical protein
MIVERECAKYGIDQQTYVILFYSEEMGGDGY